MNTLQFEAVKVAMKQDKTGFILTLNVHPDDVPMELVRDFVGAHYQVVMVRLNGENKPMNRDVEYQRDPVRAAGILCKHKGFAKFLIEAGQIFDDDERAVAQWLKEKLGVNSRSELKDNQAAAKRFWQIKEEFELWNNGD
jgi:hypothetical protein